MFVIFDSEILNLNNVVSIAMEEYSENEVKITIVTTAIRYYSGDYLTGSEHYNAYCKEYIVEAKKCSELLKAIKNGEKIFVM